MLILLTFLGHPVHGSWVVGVRDEDGKIRAEVVPDRGTVQLTRFIERYVRPGSWLHSDNWRGYANGTSNTQDILGAMGVRGLSVNHEKTFKEWIPEHRKWGCTNSIEGDWNAFIAKTPKRKYGYKNITPYLRQVEWDREANNIWLDWWRALFCCTKEKATQFCLRLNELHSTDPNTPKPTHPLLRMYPRGFHTLRGNNVGSQSSRSKFHYAYTSHKKIGAPTYPQSLRPRGLTHIRATIVGGRRPYQVARNHPWLRAAKIGCRRPLAVAHSTTET